MTKLYKFCVIVVIALSMWAPYLSAQTVVYTNDFPGTTGSLPIPFGSPSCLPGSVHLGGSAGTGANSGVKVGGWATGTSVALADNMLAAWVSNDFETFCDRYAFVSPPLAPYLAPFNSTLSLNNELVTWTFNMRTSAPVSGYWGSQNIAVTVLATDVENYQIFGNGYAVVFNPSMPRGVQLVRFTSGLVGTVTPVISSSAVLASATNYASIKVVYQQSLNQWTLYVRDDGPTSFLDPSIGVTSLEGTAVDEIFTSIPMSHFGFYGNYSLPRSVREAQFAYFDNYTVTMNCPKIAEGGLNTCIGMTTTLTNPTPGGTWTSGTPSVATIGSASGIVTGISTGTSIVTYVAGGCTVNAIVTVNPLPVGPAITGGLTICAGATTTLSTIPPSVPGTWSSSTTSVATVNPTTGVVTGMSGGTAIISFTVPSGCFSTTILTVNPIGPIEGSPTFCEGEVRTLTNVASGGAWSSDDLSVAAIDVVTGEVTAISAGTAAISYLMPTGCSSAEVVTVSPTPTPITGEDSVCVGFTTSLFSSGGGTWTSASTGIATISSSGVVTGVTADTVVITYAYATGCNRTATVTVVSPPPAISGTLTVCTGRTTTLTNTSVGGTWSSSDMAVATIGSTSGVATGVTVGTANISYTLIAGCNTGSIVTVISSPAAITGAAALCEGSTTALANTTPGGDWTSSNTGVATIDIATGVLTGVVPGTATISYTTSNGCFETVVATVNPIPNAITGTPTVCVGAQTTLSSSSGGGTWSSGDIAIATVSGGGIVTGVSAGTTSITYTRLGCITTAVVTVNDIPAIIGVPGPVCIGSNITLTNAATGGTWSSSNISIATIGLATGVVSTVATGTTTVTYRFTTTGCFRTQTITVNPLPGTITGPSTLCPASNMTLTCTPAGGTWASSNSAIATIVSSTGVLTGVAMGTATISYTSPAGCVRTTIVSISSAPPAIITPIGDTVFCPGDFVTLTSSTSPGVTYEWYRGGVLIPTATSPTYIASMAGSYQVKVVVAAGCSSLSVPMDVAVAPATATITVPGGITATCTGMSVALDANTGVGLTYQWQLGGTALAGATASTFNALTGGSYTVRVTNSAGCWAVSAPTSISVNPVPVDVITASGPLTFCDGNSVTLTAASGAGYTYQWYNTSGLIAGATSSSYTATTIEDYYAEITNSAGCMGTSVISSVMVNPLPDVTITAGGQLIFCVGGFVLLGAPAGYNYQWYKDGGAISGATNISYVATMGGGYRVRVTDGATGCADITHADTQVVVITTPTVTPMTPSRFCWGGSSLLSTSVSYLGGAIAYQWYFNGVVIPGANSGTYNATAEGDYHCEVSVPASCIVSMADVHVVELPLPDPPIAFNGTIFRTGSYYLSYQWYKNLVAIPGAVTASTPATSNGNYKVAVTDTNGCQSVSAVYVLTGWKGTAPTSVTDVNGAEIKIFPNPTKEMVFIESAVQVRAVISSVDGKTLIDKENANKIDLSGLADGLYIISLYNDAGQLVVVQKLSKI